jgi:hypothetical protein
MESLIEQRIFRANPWWIDKSYLPEEVNWPKRACFENLKSLLEDRFMISLLGLRRTGKSTLMMQTIAKLLQEKIAPKNIFFYSFSETLEDKNPKTLEAIINNYFEKIIKNPVKFINERVYVLLDEIQYVDNWMAVLKSFYDASSKIKFIISGSFSLKLQNKDKESLAGRIFELDISPLDFSEYLSIKYPKESISYDQKLLLTSFDAKSFDNFDNKLFIEKYSKDFEEFILWGNFPETIGLSTIEKKYNYIENSILNKLIENDIPQIFNFKKYDELKLLANALIQESGSMYQIKNLTEITKINTKTMSKYLKAFEESFLLQVVPSFHRSFHKSNKTLKKSYVTSPNFTAALLNLRPENSLLNEIMGKLVETYVLQRLKADSGIKNIHFFRKGQNEIDFVIGSMLIDKKSNWNFVEVKYRNEIKHDDLKFLRKYLLENNLNKAFVVTKKRFELIKSPEFELYLIPAIFL